MVDISLNHEEWFKIYIVLDTFDIKKEYNKNFLLFLEYWKRKIKITMCVYVSSVESLTVSPDSEFYEFSQKEELLKSTSASEDEYTSLFEEYDSIIKEHSAQVSEVGQIKYSLVTYTGQKIPTRLLPDLDEEVLEVLEPLIGSK